MYCSPVSVVPDPIRGEDNVLVLCEVFYPDGTPHETNTRAKLEALITDKVRKEAPLFGFEQASLFPKPLHVVQNHAPAAAAADHLPGLSCLQVFSSTM